MGKIIRNGIEFSGACEDATAVNYNNSLSGLEAQTVQEGLDEVSNSLGGLEFAIVDGVPHWKERGADSFSPFSSNDVVVIFNNGVLHEITGGLIAEGTTASYAINGNNLAISRSGALCSVRTVNKIDFTKYSKLIVNGDTSNISVAISTKDGSEDTSSITPHISPNGYIDLSNYSGEYYIKFGVVNSSSSTRNISCVVLL